MNLYSLFQSRKECFSLYEKNQFSRSHSISKLQNKFKPIFTRNEGGLVSFSHHKNVEDILIAHGSYEDYGESWYPLSIIRFNELLKSEIEGRGGVAEGSPTFRRVFELESMFMKSPYHNHFFKDIIWGSRNRYIYTGSEDLTLSKFDVHGLKTVSMANINAIPTRICVDDNDENSLFFVSQLKCGMWDTRRSNKTDFFTVSTGKSNNLGSSSPCVCFDIKPILEDRLLLICTSNGLQLHDLRKPSGKQYLSLRSQSCSTATSCDYAGERSSEILVTMGDGSVFSFHTSSLFHSTGTERPQYLYQKQHELESQYLEYIPSVKHYNQQNNNMGGPGMNMRKKKSYKTSLHRGFYAPPHNQFVAVTSNDSQMRIFDAQTPQRLVQCVDLGQFVNPESEVLNISVSSALGLDLLCVQTYEKYVFLSPQKGSGEHLDFRISSFNDTKQKEEGQLLFDDWASPESGGKLSAGLGCCSYNLGKIVQKGFECRDCQSYLMCAECCRFCHERLDHDVNGIGLKEFQCACGINNNESGVKSNTKCALYSGGGDSDEKKNISENDLRMAMDELVKIYCYCRRGYEPQQTMYQCVGCREWYHSDCVGFMKPVDEDEEEEDDEICNFYCEVCFPIHIKCLENMQEYPQIGVVGKRGRLLPLNWKSILPEECKRTFFQISQRDEDTKVENVNLLLSNEEPNSDSVGSPGGGGGGQDNVIVFNSVDSPPVVEGDYILKFQTTGPSRSDGKGNGNRGEFEFVEIGDGEAEDEEEDIEDLGEEDDDDGLLAEDIMDEDEDDMGII